MKFLFIIALALASIAPVYAQKEIPKAEGHDQCPLGYVNTLGFTCVSPIYYEVAPTNGEACNEGWMNIGAGYCKKKKGPLGIRESTNELRNYESFFVRICAFVHLCSFLCP